MAKQDLLIELFYGGRWNAVKGRPTRGVAQIDWGKSDPLADPTPTALTLALDWAGGTLNPRNPLSPLYGVAGRNVPIRVARRPRDTTGPLADARDQWARTLATGWGTADVGGAWSTATTGGTAAWHSVSSGAGRHNVMDPAAYAIAYLQQLDVQDVTVTVTVAAPQATGASLEPANIALRMQNINDYVLARVELTTLNAVVLRVYNAADVQIGTATVPGLVHAGTGTPLRVSARAVGQHIMMKVWPAAGVEPATWHLVVTDPSPRVSGWVGLRSGRATGNTNSVGPQFAYTNLVMVVEDTRCTAEVSEFRPQRTEDYAPGKGKGDAWVDVVAGGVLRRIGKGTDPRSALWRRVASGDPIAYWPMEDQQDADRAGSGVPGGQQLAIASGIIDFDDENVPPGTAGFARVQEDPAGVLTATLPPFQVDGGWQVAIWAKGTGTYAGGPVGASFDGLQIMGMDTSDGYRWLYSITNGFGGIGVMSVNGYDPTGAVVAGGTHPIDMPLPGFLEGGWHLLHMVWHQVTPTTGDFELWSDGVLVDSAAGQPGSGVPRTVRILDNIDFVEAGDIGIMHVAIFPHDNYADQWQAGQGWPGETAAWRIAGIAGDRGVSVTVVGDPNDCQVMGPQYPDTTLNLLGEAERTDSGLLVDSRDALDLTYRTGRSMYAQTPALELSFTDQSIVTPLDPVLGDQATRNDVTVNRREGSSARAVQETGPMNVNDPADDPQGVGRTVATIDINPTTDAVLPDHASWWLHFGTVDEITFAQVTVNADKVPGLATAVSAVGAGDLIALADLPADLSPDLARLIVIGGKERHETHRRLVTFNCVPASPYDVGIWDDPPTPTSTRYDTLQSVTAADITTGVHTVMSVAAGELWTQDQAHYPVDLRVSGARVRADAIGQVLNVNPFLRTSAVGWTGLNGTAIYSTAQRFQPEYGSLLVTPTGAGIAEARASALLGGIVAGVTYRIGAWIYTPAAWASGFRVGVNVHDAGGTLLTTLQTPITVIPAGVWTWLGTEVTAPGSTTQARLFVSQQGTPAAGNPWYTTVLLLVPRSTYDSSPQTFTINPDPINGVEKLIPSGTPVRLWQPALWGL